MDNDTNTTIGKVVAVTFGRAVVVGDVVNADLVLVDAVELVTEGVVVLGAFVVPSWLLMTSEEVMMTQHYCRALTGLPWAHLLED